jgi:D-glycero-alpha-D-manno-heptose-7-phosphate kinase
MKIRARAPLRLGLAGGGTDVSPYCDIYGGYVLNATIQRHAYALLETEDQGSVKFVATDQNLVDEINDISSISLNGPLRLHRAVYMYMMKNYNNGKNINLELTTYCESPMGSGLGSSSTLVVVMIHTFVEMLNLPFDDYAIAKLAFEIERFDCGLHGGRQDHYSAAFGGFNFMEFYSDSRTVVNPIRVKDWILCELEASILLYYTGVSRESAQIIEDQRNNVIQGEMEAIEAMHLVKQEAMVMKECLLKGDFNGIVESMKYGWENKKKSALSVSNSKIDNVYDVAINAGATAGKVSGAGGGGFMMFLVPPKNRMAVVKQLVDQGGEVSYCHFTKYGSQVWKI